MMNNWIEEARFIAKTSRRSEIKTMLDFGKVLCEMIKDKHYSKACRNHTLFASELNKDGEFYTTDYFEACQLLYGKFPKLHELMIETGMRERVAMKACHWTFAVMEERLQEAQKTGWGNIIEKYIMRKRIVYRQKKREFVHRANSLANGSEVNINLLNLKHKGEWNDDLIRQHLENLMTTIPHFEMLCNQARESVEKLRNPASIFRRAI